MATHYSTIDAVLVRTGVKPEDLGFVAGEEESGEEESGSGDAFGDFITELLEEVADLMDRKMHKSYLEEASIPKGLNGIAADAASNAVREMVATRQTPVVRIDDFAVRVIQSNVLTADILERLKLYSAGGGARSVDIGQDEMDALNVIFSPDDLV